MSRVVQITVPAQDTDSLLSELREVQGVLGIQLQRGVAVEPPGDVFTVEALNPAVREVLLRLHRRGIGSQPGSTVRTTEFLSLAQSGRSSALALDSSESSWEEMEQSIGKESNMTWNGRLIMAVSGFMAAIGLITNSIHYVIAAQLIGPGFEPLSRIALGLVSASRAWRRGLRHSAEGYAWLLIGSVLGTAMARVSDVWPPGAPAAYLSQGVLLSYWTQPDLSAYLIAIAASAGGAILIAANRPVLTGGVMVALDLIPGGTMVGIALVTADPKLGAAGLRRLLIQAALVVIMSAVVFAWKRRSQRRNMMQ